ncbi:hypothetical protein KC19_3G057600 [Ceratodon purpureus]|uniref:Uncharacterized protein n=1 Tax=Ceratodon purpureus TaxID=3225 RepID=A0A8T0IIW9_CERPU|nr:hypothetical protein KC19_3G057600 [Ceratodon purpureus]
MCVVSAVFAGGVVLRALVAIAMVAAPHDNTRKESAWWIPRRGGRGACSRTDCGVSTTSHEWCWVESRILQRRVDCD